MNPRVLRMLALPSALIALWEIAGRAYGGPRTPLPSKVAYEAIALIQSGDLPWSLAESLLRVFSGFAIATAIAAPLGLAMGRWRALERNLDPVVESFRPVAAIAMLPLAILWLGAGFGAAVMLVAYAAFFPILIHTIAGAKGVDRSLARAAATMGVGGVALVRTVVLPAALPQMAIGLRIGLGVAWTAIVAAELAVGAKAGGGTSGGVGQMMFAYYAYSIELNRIVVCMIAVGLISLVLDRLMRFALARAMPWTAE